MPAIGPLEIGVILLIVLLVVGPKKLPGLGRNLGTGMREFKDSITGRSGDDSDEEPAKIDAAAAETKAAGEPSAAPEKQPRGDA
ncbi:MAG: twin-arginine translocase TatA/TatE family subunit [Solirubrobacterales bacterium]|jgi:sec-independent protein translocase protein TatA|nr:twin-arginine translocase TatA/TatE family subunit [Solirubrobacterales bacterium]